MSRWPRSGLSPRPSHGCPPLGLASLPLLWRQGPHRRLSPCSEAQPRPVAAQIPTHRPASPTPSQGPAPPSPPGRCPSTGSLGGPGGDSAQPCKRVSACWATREAGQGHKPSAPPSSRPSMAGPASQRPPLRAPSQHGLPMRSSPHACCLLTSPLPLGLSPELSAQSGPEEGSAQRDNEVHRLAQKCPDS